MNQLETLQIFECPIYRMSEIESQRAPVAEQTRRSPRNTRKASNYRETPRLGSSRNHHSDEEEEEEEEDEDARIREEDEEQDEEDIERQRTPRASRRPNRLPPIKRPLPQLTTSAYDED